MLIAREKKENNIAEYILYMWSLENILRAYSLDINKVKENIIDNYNISGELKNEMYEWYDNLIQMMKLENLEEKGHLNINKIVLDDFNKFHMHLLNDVKDPQYIFLFNSSVNNIVEFREKNKDITSSDIEICLNALFGIWMLKLQKKEISKQTLSAINSISKLLAMLSLKYKENEDKLKKEQ